jgi:hypothetical protein
MEHELTPRQIEMARHALGLDGRRKVSYRNRYVTGLGSADHALCAACARLVAEAVRVAYAFGRRCPSAYLGRDGRWHRIASHSYPEEP